MLSIVFAAAVASPTTRHQDHLRQASEVLRLTQDPAHAIPDLDAAAEIIPADTTTTRWRVSLRLETASALAAYGRMPEANELLNESLAILDHAELSGFSPLSTSRHRGQLATQAYQITSDRDWLRLAEEAYSRAIAINPLGLNDHVKLGDTRWQLGEFSAADEAYREAISISDHFYLDPDTQLPESERRRITLRLNADTGPPVTD